jgi:hypothetical protein
MSNIIYNRFPTHLFKARTKPIEKNVAPEMTIEEWLEFLNERGLDMSGLSDDEEEV